MKNISMLLTVLILSIAVALPLTAHAAGSKAKSEVVMKMGNKLHLFHSGPVEANKEVTLGEVIPVFRQSGKNVQSKQVGEVKVTGFLGEHYFEAEVIKGEVKVGDIAQKNKSGYLVQPVK